MKRNCFNCLKKNVCMFLKEFKEIESRISGVISDLEHNIFEVNITCKEWADNKTHRNLDLGEKIYSTEAETTWDCPKCGFIAVTVECLIDEGNENE